MRSRADEVVARSTPRPPEASRAAACFELGQHLHRAGHADDAVPWFREAHRLQPDNWTYKRQAWELVDPILQGPSEQYDGDWLSDVREIGARTTTRRSICSGRSLRPGLKPGSALDRLAIRLNLAPVAAGHALFGMPMARVTIAGQRLGIFARLARGPATAPQLAQELGLDPGGAMLLLDSLAALEHVDKQRDAVRPVQERAQVARPGLGGLRRDVHRALLRLLELVGPARGHRAHRRGRRDPRLRARRPALGDVHPRPVPARAHQLTGGREGAAAAVPARVPARRRRRTRLVLGRAVPPPSDAARDGARPGRQRRRRPAHHRRAGHERPRAARRGRHDERRPRRPARRRARASTSSTTCRPSRTSRCCAACTTRWRPAARSRCSTSGCPRTTAAPTPPRCSACSSTSRRRRRPTPRRDVRGWLTEAGFEADQASDDPPPAGPGAVRGPEAGLTELARLRRPRAALRATRGTRRSSATGPRGPRTRGSPAGRRAGPR